MDKNHLKARNFGYNITQVLYVKFFGDNIELGTF